MEAKKKAKKTVVPQMINFPSTDINNLRISGGDVMLRGSISMPTVGNELKEQAAGLKKLSSLLNSIGPRVEVIDPITKKTDVFAITFNDDCTFNTKIHIPHPMFVALLPFCNLYMCPGDTVDFVLDGMIKTNKKGFNIGGTGLSGEINRVITSVDKAYCNNYSSYDIKDAKQIDSLMTWRNVQIGRMDSMVAKINRGLPELKGCSPLASDIVLTHILAWHLQMIASPYFIVLRDISSDQALWRNYFDFLSPREKYLLDNPLLMVSADMFFFNRLEYTAFRPLTQKKMSIMSHRKKTFVFGDSLQSLHTAIAKGLQQINDELHLSSNDFTSQVCMIRDVFSSFQCGIFDNEEIKAEAIASVAPYITNQELLRLAILGYHDYIKEDQQSCIDNKPASKGDSLFQRIIEPYKGNVLYVDFWSMSCGPCRAGMLDMRDEVEANKDKPVKYLYITYDTEEHCRSFLEPNNIKGEHIFISRSEWAHLQEKFNFSGIPFVVHVDRQGKIRREPNINVKELLAE
ncbi:thioredoxin-like domain-containing protein [Prevotella sp. MGM1]|uniref:TlpA family protein disulfide reductase n=1 Tax=Prevotella sp. MGM1 TaxID=2033405 RepID=UPI001304D072|nr:redoxin domain-containing protein [Prevotella sp. MGM1]